MPLTRAAPAVPAWRGSTGRVRPPVAAEASARPCVGRPQPSQPLTERETEVVRAVARGRTNQEIAAELFISLSTVKGHLNGIQNKLGVRNRVQITAWAWESRLMF